MPDDRKEEQVAFPCPATFFQFRDGTSAYHQHEGGMLLRDYFAGQALMGMLASDSSVDRTRVVKRTLAAVAYEFADAMMEARGTK